MDCVQGAQSALSSAFCFAELSLSNVSLVRQKALFGEI